MNRVEVSGGLVRDAETSQIGQTVVVKFTVAVNGTRYDSEKQEQVVKTTFVSVEAWSSVGQHALELGLTQGDMVYVIGELAQVQKEKGESSTRLMAFRVDLLRTSRRHETGGGDPWA